MHPSLLALIALSGVPPPTPAAALPAAVRYALIIGNNAAGPGQTPLRYAERDARAVADVLEGLGDYPPDHVDVLASPDLEQVRAALDAAAVTLAERAEHGEQTVFTFYYSGHARSDALDFGEDLLPLGELRARLLALPSAVTLVVLDACRSGAFGRAKGAAQVEDFSVNSVRRLDARGMAVLASSSAGELSQESEALEGSFFTHHLIVALRGAADGNHDGRVALGEAYQYAYHQTLLSTARTEIGRQHVTFETRLAGQGDLPLTAPGAGLAHLELSADLEGDVMVSTDGPGRPVVVAELHKAPGQAARIAVPPGLYRGLVRQGDRLGECAVEVVRGAVARLGPDDCASTEVTAGAAKGVEPGFSWSEGWMVEAAVGLQTNRDSDYTDRLEAFGYNEQVDFGVGEVTHFSLSGGKRVHPHLSVLLNLRTLDRRSFELDDRALDDPRSFDLQSYGAALMVRSDVDFFNHVLGAYAQVGGGAVLAFDRLEDESGRTEWGYLLVGGVGLQSMPWRHLGLFAEADYLVAPALSNRLGDTHDHGGTGLFLGLRGVL